MTVSLSHLSAIYNIGPETLKDIFQELQKPGHDPRDDLAPPVFASNVMDIQDLKIGDLLDGVVRNITDFGAFVDIGLHNDGLVHKSQLANHFVTNPLDVVHLGQAVKVRVLAIDLEKEKISLSMKTETATPPPQKKAALLPQQSVRPVSEDAEEMPSTGGKIKFI